MGKLLTIIIIAIIAYMVYTHITKPSVSVQFENNRVIITAGKHTITGERVLDGTQSFLVIGASAKKINYGAGYLGVIELGQAEYLKSIYGNFLRCDNRGANDAKNKVKNIMPVIADANVNAVLKKAARIKERGNYPVIEITGSELKILKHTFHHSDQDVDIPVSGDIHYLINDIRIINENFNF